MQRLRAKTRRSSALHGPAKKRTLISIQASGILMSNNYVSLTLGICMGIAADRILQTLLFTSSSKDDQGSLISTIWVYVKAIYSKTFKQQRRQTDHFVKGGFWSLVGDTPVVRINSLSDDLGIEVYGKAEFLNPGGSIKDRVARQMILQAERDGHLKKVGDAVIEGTSGSTGISLALASQCRGYHCFIFMPDDQAKEKAQSLEILGAKVAQLPAVSIIHPEHYVNAAKKAAQNINEDTSQNGFFANQFENLANFSAHYEGTGKEILKQMDGKIDAFVASSGTGGTIAGTSCRLKEWNQNIQIILGDPEGSGLVNKIRHGVLYNTKDAEGYRTKRIADTIVEGIGINRMTKNFLKGYRYIDHAYTITDLECVHMSRYLISKDGLFCGSSSALNCCAIVKAWKEGVIKPGSTVVVILCDSGFRHLTRFYNSAYLKSHNLLPNYIEASAFITFENQKMHTASIQAANADTPPQSVLQFVN